MDKMEQIKQHKEQLIDYLFEYVREDADVYTMRNYSTTIIKLLEYNYGKLSYDEIEQLIDIIEGGLL